MADAAVARRAVGAAALVILACAVFVPAVWAGFLSDDFLLLTNLHHGGIGWVFSHNDIGEAGAAGHFYRPVWVLWNLWLFKAFGGSATAFHVSNLLLFSVVVLEVWALSATFVGASRAWIAAAAFAVYPRHGESVAWVSGNTDLVAVTAALAALLVVRSRASLAVRVAGAVVLTVLATLSKEIAFTLPVLALLVLRRRDDRRELLIPAAMLLVEVGTFAARFAVIGGIGGYSQFPWTPKLLVGSYGSYVLASGIPPSVEAFRYEAVLLLPVALLGLVVWRVLVLRRRGATQDVRLVGIGVAWFVVALLPLGSLPVDLNNANGERNLMLASVGLALALAGLMPRPRRAWAATAAGAAICALAALTLYSSFDWIEAGRLNKRLLPAAAAMAPRGGELILLSHPEGFRTAHVFIGGDLSQQFRYHGITDRKVAFCAPVELRAVRSGEVSFKPSAGSYLGLSGWSAAFDFPVLHSAAGLTGECSYSRAPGGPKPPGLGLRVRAIPAPYGRPVVLAYFDGRDLRRCC
jgi:hypothetical protein